MAESKSQFENKTQIKKKRVQLGKLVLASCLIMGIGLGCTRNEDQKGLQVFHGAIKDDVKTWDPANAYDTVSLSLVPGVYETLYQYAYLKEVYEIEPLLAASMPEYSKDKLTLTIPIKKGVRFQDDSCFEQSKGKGRELKAQDFVYGIKRLALPSIQSAGWWIFDEKIVGLNEFRKKLESAKRSDYDKVMQEEVEGLKALDDYTLQIKLIRPYPQILYVLSMSFTAPVAKEAVSRYADERGNLTDHPVGTGPFVLKEWSRNREIILEKNKGFRSELFPTKTSSRYETKEYLADAGKPMPFLDRIEIEVTKEAQPRWLNFMKGNTDVLIIPKDNFSQAVSPTMDVSPELSEKGVRLRVETGAVIRYVSFNMKDKLLGSNKLLRQALSSAIDRNEWIQIFTNGTGKKMVNLVPPGISDRPKTNVIRYDYDLRKAKELLAKAGYPNGEGLPVLKFDLRGAATTDRQLGDFFERQFAKIGVRIEVIPNTFPAYLEKLKQGNLQVSFGGWSLDYPDAENIYQLVYGPNGAPGPADSNYDNPEVNLLYEKMAILESGKERSKIIQKMDDIVQEDCPWALGYYEASYDLTQPWFFNYRVSDIILNKYKYYRIDRALKEKILKEAS